MSFIPLIIQGMMFGFVASIAFDPSTETLPFVGACVANAVLTVMYGTLKMGK